MDEVTKLKVENYDDIVNTKNEEYKELVRLYRKQNKKLQRIEDYLDRHSDVPIEVVVNIKNIIHSEVEDEVIQ